MSLLSFPLALFNLGMPEILGILAIVLLLFGGAKLPALARGLGQSVKEFKKASREGDEDEKDPKKTETATKPGNN
ncbi:MAG: twin-arginine translocation protein TatA/E family subunit [Lacunisphaera sp.]|nr:twin-arginine translocation protein TatA/E family subunit [Lacunisphaera sp.]